MILINIVFLILMYFLYISYVTTTHGKIIYCLCTLNIIANTIYDLVQLIQNYK